MQRETTKFKIKVKENKKQNIKVMSAVTHGMRYAQFRPDDDDANGWKLATISTSNAAAIAAAAAAAAITTTTTTSLTINSETKQ